MAYKIVCRDSVEEHILDALVSKLTRITLSGKLSFPLRSVISYAIIKA